MDGCLVVVSRTRSELWHELVRRHAASPGVEVILDRRITARVGSALETDGFVVIPR